MEGDWKDHLVLGIWTEWRGGEEKSNSVESKAQGKVQSRWKVCTMEILTRKRASIL